MKFTLFLNKPIELVSLFLLIAGDLYSQETTTMIFTTPATTDQPRGKLQFRLTFEESCDYLAHYCLRAYVTGTLCARTPQYVYHTFKNFCMLDYVNCMERYEVWQIVHMGECFDFPLETEYALYHYDDDDFLNETYVVEDH